MPEKKRWHKERGGEVAAPRPVLPRESVELDQRTGPTHARIGKNGIMKYRNTSKALQLIKKKYTGLSLFGGMQSPGSVFCRVVVCYRRRVSVLLFMARCSCSWVPCVGWSCLSCSFRHSSPTRDTRGGKIRTTPKRIFFGAGPGLKYHRNTEFCKHNYIVWWYPQRKDRSVRSSIPGSLASAIHGSHKQWD